MQKLVLNSILTILIFYAVFGMNICVNMNKDMGQMSHADYSISSTLPVCQMPLTAHLTKWRQALEATFSQIYAMSRILIAIGVSLAFSLMQYTLAPPLMLAFKRYKEKNPDTRLFNQLLLAISNGIVQPKLYA